MINSVEIKYNNSDRYPVISINGEVISRYMSLADYIYDDIFRWADQFFSIIDAELAEDYTVNLIAHPFHKMVLECNLSKSEFCKGISFKQIENKISFKDKYDFAYCLNQKYSILPDFADRKVLFNTNTIEQFTDLDIASYLTVDASDYSISYEESIIDNAKVNVVISGAHKIEKNKNSTTIFITKDSLCEVIEYFNIYHLYLPLIEETFARLSTVSLDTASKLEFEAFSKEEYRYIVSELPSVTDVGEKIEIKYDYFPKCFEKPAIKVFVDNPSVITYENGLLITKDKGICEIRICDMSGNEICTKSIEVNKHNFATNITIVLPTTSMNIGETMKFRCIPSPNDAEDANDLRYSVSDEKIAVISGTNELYAVSSGRVCVTVSTARISKKFYITVLSQANDILVSGTDIEVPYNAEAVIYCEPIPREASPAPVISWLAQNNGVFRILRSDSTKCTILTQNFGSAYLKCRIDGTDIEKEIKITVPKQKGCYVATSVYGSYDCPEVWVLRRFRDNYLDKFTLGRIFIESYYAISPTVVKIFGGSKLFNHFWKAMLDKMVSKLRKKGYEDTPYNDGE